MRRIIQIETSCYDPGGYWVYGSEYFAANVTIEYPEALDILDDEELDELASDDDVSEVFYLRIDEGE